MLYTTTYEAVTCPVGNDPEHRFTFTMYPDGSVTNSIFCKLYAKAWDFMGPEFSTKRNFEDLSSFLRTKYNSYFSGALSSEAGALGMILEPLDWLRECNYHFEVVDYDWVQGTRSYPTITISVADVESAVYIKSMYC